MAPHLMRAQGAYKADKHATPTHAHTHKHPHTPTRTCTHTHTHTHTHTGIGILFVWGFAVHEWQLFKSCLWRSLSDMKCNSFLKAAYVQGCVDTCKKYVAIKKLRICHGECVILIIDSNLHAVYMNKRYASIKVSGEKWFSIKQNWSIGIGYYFFFQHLNIFII